ncbi:MAG: PepSY-associated helix protein [Burkholderiaceae bacterium]|nr:PepSY-associated helix protein [Burkholderiaceae bacterium]
MRPRLVLLHRYVGLAMAPFLFIAGLTGAVIAWQQELDTWLNPQLFVARTAGASLPATELARRLEAADPRVQISTMPLALAPGAAFVARVQPRLDPQTGKPFELEYNQVALDPASGEIQAKRDLNSLSLSRETLLPFLRRLHYSLHLPTASGIQTGVWLMGLVALGWLLDCFVSLAISFPNLNAWRKSFVIRWRDGGYKRQFDLHRSGGVWIWGLLLMLAVSSVSLNLHQQVMRPVVSLFSTLSPSPFAGRMPLAPSEHRISLEQAISLAKGEAASRGWNTPAGGLFFSPRASLYGVGFFEPGNERGGAGLGNNWLYFDARSGELVGALVPGSGSRGDIFLQAMYPIHSGRILGLPGRILMTFIGLAIAVLCVTGMVIWAKKRRSRLQQEAKLKMQAKVQKQQA